MVHIRAARPTDLETIVDFNYRLAAESEGKSLDKAKLRPGVSALLADPKRGRYFIAEEAGRPIGQVMHTYEWSDWRNGMFWWIQSVYIIPEARGRGVFASLFRHLRALADEEGGVCGLRLYVEEANTAARAVYSKMGLGPTGYRVMEWEF